MLILNSSIIICWIILLLLIAYLSRKYLPKENELSRKIVHIGTGAVVPIAWWLEITKEVSITVSALITIALVINHKLRIIPALEDINRESYGTIAYGFSITLLMINLWEDHPAAVSAGVLVMAIGDGLAGLVGPKINSRNWKILNQTKSLAGTLTMALSTAIIIIVLITITENPFIPINLIIITLSAVILEQIGPLGIDNITVPIGTAYLWLLLGLS